MGRHKKDWKPESVNGREREAGARPVIPADNRDDSRSAEKQGEKGDWKLKEGTE